MGRYRVEGSTDHRKKPRESRTRNHPEEWIMDVQAYLQKHGGEIIGSQALMAKKMKIPLRSFKVLVAAVKAGEIEILRVRCDIGRKGSTTLSLAENEPQNKPPSE